MQNETKPDTPTQQNEAFLSEKSQSELTEKITAPPVNDEKKDENLMGLTKNQRRNLKKKKLKKKKQAAKKAQIEIEQHIQGQEAKDEESDIPNEEVKAIEKNKKPENLNLDEAFNNQEKDQATSKAKDATKIHFDK